MDRRTEIDMNNKYEIGQVFYTIQPATEDERCLHRACRVCGGEKILTVNDVTFDCPVCKNEEVFLRVSAWKVARYKIYKVEEEVDTQFWDISKAKPRVKYSLFRKRPRNENHFFIGTTSMSVCQDDFDRYLNRPPYLDDDPSLLNEMLFGAGYVFFDDYKLAVKTADEMTKQQIDKVKAYNEKSGTDFSLPVFNVIHDKK